MRWDQYHSKPHVSYYLFLRKVYCMYADEAWERVQKSFNLGKYK